LGVTDAGHGMAVWQEVHINEPLPHIFTATMVPVWSKSDLGGPWTAPEVIGSNFATVGELDQDIPIRFALNRNGQGVAALTVFRTDGVAGLRNGLRYIATARYSVAAGWSDWIYVASAPDFSVPNVAINAAGDAFLIYAAVACTRSGSPPVPGACGDTQNIYVLKIPQ
jgi:hypothetical protein